MMLLSAIYFFIAYRCKTLQIIWNQYIKKIIAMIIHSLIYSHCIGAVAHLARAFEWHSKGSGFKSHQLHLKTQKVIQSLLLQSKERYSKEPLLISLYTKSCGTTYQDLATVRRSSEDMKSGVFRTCFGNLCISPEILATHLIVSPNCIEFCQIV